MIQMGFEVIENAAINYLTINNYLVALLMIFIVMATAACGVVYLGSSDSHKENSQND